MLKCGGRVISINGTPDANMARVIGLNPLMQLVIKGLSYKTNAAAKKLGVYYKFHFMKPSGAQLDVLCTLFEDETMRPAVDKVYPLASIKEALEYSELGKSKGKIVILV